MKDVLKALQAMIDSPETPNVTNRETALSMLVTLGLGKEEDLRASIKKEENHKFAGIGDAISRMIGCSDVDENAGILVKALKGLTGQTRPFNKRMSNFLSDYSTVYSFMETGKDVPSSVTLKAVERITTTNNEIRADGMGILKAGETLTRDAIASILTVLEPVKTYCENMELWFNTMPEMFEYDGNNRLPEEIEPFMGVENIKTAVVKTKASEAKGDNSEE